MPSGVTTDGLPTGWATAKVRDIAVKVGSGATPTGGEANYKQAGVPLIRSMNVHFGGFREDGLVYLDDDQAADLANVEVCAHDVLLNITGASIGRVTTAPEHLAGARVNQHVCIIRPVVDVEPNFLCWFLASPHQQSVIFRVQVGATRQALTKDMILNFEVPIPPLPEQRRIVAKVEELFSDLDAGVAALERVRANLKRYRASVLRAAVEGRLTAEWRAAHADAEPASELLARVLADRRTKWEADQQAKFAAANKPPPTNWQAKYAEPSAPDTANLPDPPAGWAVASLDQLASVITSGSRDWSQYYGEGSGTFLMAQNVRPGRLDLSFRQSVNPPRDDRDRIRSQVAADDLLITIVGANTGDVCRVPQELPEHYVCQSVTLIRFVTPAYSRYLETYLTSDENGQKQFRRYIYGAGRPHLSFDQLRMTAVYLPPLAEQERIVAEVEERLSVASAAERQVEADLARASRLRQAILKRAFAGKLVPQDPADEPAAALLERIRAARAEAPPAKPRSRRAKS